MYKVFFFLSKFLLSNEHITTACSVTDVLFMRCIFNFDGFVSCEMLGFFFCRQIKKMHTETEQELLHRGYSDHIKTSAFLYICTTIL